MPLFDVASHHTGIGGGLVAEKFGGVFIITYMGSIKSISVEFTEKATKVVVGLNFARSLKREI